MMHKAFNLHFMSLYKRSGKLVWNGGEFKYTRNENKYQLLYKDWSALTEEIYAVELC